MKRTGSRTPHSGSLPDAHPDGSDSARKEPDRPRGSDGEIVGATGHVWSTIDYGHVDARSSMFFEADPDHRAARQCLVGDAEG